MKKVSDLTPEEFLKTFPITLKPHDPAYALWYEEEKRRIIETVGEENTARMNHIGSSAVPGLTAKPIVDMLLEIDGTCHVEALLEKLRAIGYGEEVLTRKTDPFRVLAVRGMSCKGFADRVFFLHIRYLGDWDELYFRDYLIAHPETAKAYGDLKVRILRDIEEGRLERMPGGQPNGYSMAKLEFVKEVSRKAKAEFGGRYRPCRKKNGLC